MSIRDAPFMDSKASSAAGSAGVAASAVPAPGNRVTDALGAQALVVHSADEEPGTVLLRRDDGQHVRVPAELIVRSEAGRYHSTVPLAELDSSTQQAGDEPFVIPVIEETVQVGKRVVTRGGWRISKTVELHEETIDEPLMHDEITVERVAVNRVMDPDALPGVRQDGDTMVVPIFEEVLVVEKRMLLKEELHVRRTRKEFRAPQRAVLRRERVSVDRIDESGTPAAHSPDPA